MASRYQVEVTITSAKDLKNVNWRNGDLKPYAVVWVDQKVKSSTHVDGSGDTSPYWDHKLTIPFNSPIEESTLYIDIVHADAREDTKPLIGSARLPLRDLVDDVGLGSRAELKLKIKRPSGRPQGKLEVDVTIRDMSYRAPDPYYAPPPQQGTRDYPQANPFGSPQYGAPAYGAPQSYGQPAYPPSYGQPEHQGYEEEEKKKSSRFGGMGTGLAVGAVAGVLGAIAISEGIDAFEDNVAENVVEDLQEQEQEEEED